MKFETTGAAVVLMAVICAVSIVAVASPSDGDSLVLDGIVYGTNPDGTLSIIECDHQTARRMWSCLLRWTASRSRK